MRIEIFEWIPDEHRTEYRVYEMNGTIQRVLIDKRRKDEVWGFDRQGGQHEGKLIERERNVIVLA